MVKKAIEEWRGVIERVAGRIDTYSDRFIICPHCESKHEFEGDESETFFVEGEYEFECDSCSSIFLVNTTSRFYYETEKL